MKHEPVLPDERRKPFSQLSPAMRALVVASVGIWAALIAVMVYGGYLF